MITSTLRLLRRRPAFLSTRRTITTIYHSPPVFADYFEAVSERPTIDVEKTAKYFLVDMNEVPSRLSASDMADCQQLLVPRFRVETAENELTAEALQCWSEGMADVVHACAAGAPQLKLFYWSWRYATQTEKSIHVPRSLWRAVGSLKQLEELRLTFGENEQDTWTGFMEQPKGFPNLRVLFLDLHSAHGWDASQLEGFLSRLPKLEKLALQFPSCCGPDNISLSTTHANLKSLSLTTYLHSPSSPGSRLATDIFRRHPQLERVYLDSDYGFTVEAEDLPKLKVLGLTQNTLDSNPGFYPISQRLAKIYLQDPNEEIMQKILTPAHTSLKFLELQYTMIDTFRKHAGTDTVYERLLPTLPNLAELSIVTSSANCTPDPPQLAEDDLIAILRSTSQSSIKTIRVRDWWRAGAALSPEFLKNTQACCGTQLSSSLERIIWDVDGMPKLFVVKRDGGEVRLVDAGASLPNSEDDQLLHWHFFS